MTGRRRQLIPLRDPRSAKKRAPWAACLVRVPGGFLAFQDRRDAQAFKAETTGNMSGGQSSRLLRNAT